MKVQTRKTAAVNLSDVLSETYGAGCLVLTAEQDKMNL
jgi:hypothetical protein